MKTVDEIKHERSELIKHARNMGTRERKRAGKRLIFLKDIMDYLESRPNEEFIKNQIDKLSKRKKNIDEGFPKWSGHDEYKGKTTTSLRAIYRTETGWKTIKAQIETLNYILS